MMPELVGKLDRENATILLQYDSRRTIMQRHPAHYSRNEMEEFEQTYAAFLRDILEQFEVDEMRDWVISTYTGTIYYKD